jgi:transcriptional regulator with XRE-family HTH domain
MNVTLPNQPTEAIEEDNTTFGKRLLDIRLKTGFTQLQFATLLGITRGALSHYETGRRGMDRRMILRITNRFNISLDYLLRGTAKS